MCPLTEHFTHWPYYINYWRLHYYVLNKECAVINDVHLKMHQCSMSCSCVIMHVVGDDKPCLVDLQIMRCNAEDGSNVQFQLMDQLRLNFTRVTCSYCFGITTIWYIYDSTCTIEKKDNPMFYLQVSDCNELVRTRTRDHWHGQHSSQQYEMLVFMRWSMSWWITLLNMSIAQRVSVFVC